MHWSKHALASRSACALPILALVGISAGTLAGLAEPGANTGGAPAASITGAPAPTVAIPAAPTASAHAAPPAGSLKGAVSNVSHRKLDNGALLLSPLHENNVVDTPYGEISITAGSVALIMCSEKELCVYNLHDNHKDAVVINCGKDNAALGKSRVSLTPERVAIFARSAMKTFAEANPAPFVAYRQISIKDLSSDYKLFQADFDFGSMAHGLPQLRKLMDSEIGEQRKTMGDMLKTAAIMTQMSQSSEPYGYYVTDRVRAISADGH